MKARAQVRCTPRKKKSTRPKAIPVSAEEEIKRVIPTIKRLSKFLKTPISVDTYKAEVAKEAKEKKNLDMQYAEAFRRIKLYVPKQQEELKEAQE